MKPFIKYIPFFICFSSLANAQEVSLTVYNQNRALVREVRPMAIGEGVSTLSYIDVAAQIDPTSVHFKSLTAPDKLTILEQNYEYDLVGAQKILEKYIDQEIRVITEKGGFFSGKLLSASSSDIVIQNEKGEIQIVKGSAVQHFDFPKLPEGLITRPTLVWMVENSGPKSQNVEVSYLTDGIDWHAEYVAIVDPEDKHLDMSGWVSLDNRSGVTYNNAKLKLVAGDVNRIVQKETGRGTTDEFRLLAKAPEPQFEEKAFFEYHLYTLQRKATLKNNQTKQISLFPSTKTASDKIYLYDGAKFGEKVRVHVEFKNSKKDGLGLPLPKGKIRVYKEDVDNALEFIGEDFIDHTPVDEKVRIFLGNAFDVVGERVQKASRKISDRTNENEIEIKLRNHKKESIDIVASEHFWGDWTITRYSNPFVKKDARTAEFKLAVPAGGETILTYTVVTKW